MKKEVIFYFFIFLSYNVLAVEGISGHATSQGLNVSIEVSGAPTVNVVYPENTTYTSHVTEINYTFTGSGLQACWYTLNSGQTNTTVTCGTNVTGITSSEGGNTWKVYANNSDGTGNESVTFSVSTSSPGGGTDGGGGGGGSGGGGGGGASGGGGGGIVPTPRNFKVSPTELNIILFSGRKETYEIEIENLEDRNVTFNIDISGISQYISLGETKVVVGGNGKLKIPLVVSAPESGIYAGRIIISSGITKKEVFVILNVRSSDALFDVSLTISNAYKIFGLGQNLKTFISLLQVGEAEQVDVTVTYLIKDFEGVVLFTETETFSVYKSKSFVKEFPSSTLPSGEYIAGIDVQYPEGFATSSSHFSVVERKVNIWSVAFGALAIVAIIAIFFAISRYRKMTKQFSTKRKK